MLCWNVLHYSPEYCHLLHKKEYTCADVVKWYMSQHQITDKSKAFACNTMDLMLTVGSSNI